MGCNIHAYIEYYDKKDLGVNKEPIVNSFTYGQIELGRCYTLFGHLAGVRSCENPIVDPRGIPINPNLSWEVRHDYFLRVSDDVVKDIYDSRIISTKEAEPYLQKGNYYKVNGCDGVETLYIPNPDWHTPGWLTLDEMIEVRRRLILDFIDENCDDRKRKKEMKKMLRENIGFDSFKLSFQEFEYPSLNAIIAAMLALERSGNISRFVFWFDN